MATPTAMKQALSQQGRTPSQQGRTPSQLTAVTPPVSTPFSNPALAVLSPKANRSSPQQVKRSPAALTSTNQPSVSAFNFDSPATAAAIGALGISGGFDMGLSNVGAGGLEALGVAIASEDEKLKRLDTILQILDRKRGLVSEAGIERLAQRIGLEFLAEEQTASNGHKTRVLAIAGSVTSLDIVLDNNIVQGVSLAYHGSSAAVSRHVDAASKILLQDLQLRPDQSPMTKTLDKFAHNLGRLATLDKLSILPELDCHEALAGIFVSLERLYQWDLAKLRERPSMADETDEDLSICVMSKHHGRPTMHAHGNVGLELQYLKASDLVEPASSSDAEEEDQIWSLSLNCAPLDSVEITPIRVSEDWISSEVVNTDPSLAHLDGIALAWQEPKQTVLSRSEDTKNTGMDFLQPDLSTTPVPRVMFTVSFNPPVILPQQDWTRLHIMTGITPPVMALNHKGYSATYDSLLFPISPSTRTDPSEARTISCHRRVRVFRRDGSSYSRRHENTLFIYKPIYSQVISELPFSHPRQLIAMLPLLRQYVFLATLLETSFKPTKSQSDSSTKTSQDSASSCTIEGCSPTVSPPAEADLDAFLNSTSGNGDETGAGPDKISLKLDMVLSLQPAPQIQVAFPINDVTANITLRILEGGVAEVVEENILARSQVHFTDAEDGNGYTRKRQLALVLERLGDLCAWAEWIRTRLF